MYPWRPKLLTHRQIGLNMVYMQYGWNAFGLTKLCVIHEREGINVSPLDAG